MTVWKGFAQLNDAVLYGFVEAFQVATLQADRRSPRHCSRPCMKALVDAALAGEVAHRLVHHLGDGVAPHRAVAGRVGAVRDPAATVVIAGRAREARDAQAVDRVDDAGRGQQVELPRSRGRSRRCSDVDGLAQHAAVVRLAVGARQQAEQHRVVLAVVLQQARGLCVRAVRSGNSSWPDRKCPSRRPARARRSRSARRRRVAADADAVIGPAGARCSPSSRCGRPARSAHAKQRQRQRH